MSENLPDRRDALKQGAALLALSLDLPAMLLQQASAVSAASGFGAALSSLKSDMKEMSDGGGTKLFLVRAIEDSYLPKSVWQDKNTWLTALRRAAEQEYRYAKKALPQLKAVKEQMAAGPIAEVLEAINRVIAQHGEEFNHAIETEKYMYEKDRTGFYKKWEEHASKWHKKDSVTIAGAAKQLGLTSEQTEFLLDGARPWGSIGGDFKVGELLLHGMGPATASPKDFSNYLQQEFKDTLRDYPEVIERYRRIFHLEARQIKDFVREVNQALDISQPLRLKEEKKLVERKSGSVDTSHTPYGKRNDPLSADTQFYVDGVRNSEPYQDWTGRALKHTLRSHEK